MAQEVEPHIDEESGTVKNNVQRYLLILGFVISIAFTIGIYNAFQSDEKKATDSVKETKVEQKSEIATTKQEAIVDFNAQVSEEMRKIERKKQQEESQEALKQARVARTKSEQPFEQPVIEQKTGNKTEYDQFKEQVVESGKVRNLTDIERLADSKVRLSKEIEDFQIKEKRRALEARVATISFREIKNTQANYAQPQSTNKTASVRERIERIRQKTNQANALKDKLLAGNYNSPDQFDSLTKDLASLGVNYNAPNTNPPAINYSRIPKPTENKIVGANLEKAKELQLNGVKLPTGTAIKAVLSQTVISDYANKPFKAQITQDVYDADYETILFPKGTIIDGRSVRVANINEPIQARMGLTINWFVLPNGNRIDFSQSASALDSMGIGAIKDDVNYHAMAQFLGVLAYAVVASETASNTSSGFTGETNIKGDIGEGIREQFSPLASRYLSLVPTVTLNTGTPITVYIENEMHVEPWGTIYDNLL